MFVRLDYLDDRQIAVITMQRAEKRNALSLEMMRALQSAFETVQAEGTAYAAILRGDGPAFSAGHDLSELHCRDEAAYREIFDACVSLMETIQRIPQPVIAQVATIATAAGCQLVATCDLAVAADTARFATPGVRIGLFCTTPMVALTRAIGRKRAMEMLLTGDFIDASTAAQWGLVNRVVPAGRLEAETLAFAQSLGRASRSVIAFGKRAFYRQIEMPQGDAYAFAKEMMAINAAAAEAGEGIGSFLDKRAPRWTNEAIL